MKHAAYAFIVALAIGMMAMCMSGCALYKGITQVQGKALSEIAATDETARAKCQEVAPALLKAWPYFSGFYKGIKGKQGWETTLSTQNIELWKEIDTLAAKYAKEGVISDYDCGYFITAKFTRLMPAIIADLTRNYSTVPIVREVLDTYSFLNAAGVFG